MSSQLLSQIYNSALPGKMALVSPAQTTSSFIQTFIGVILIVAVLYFLAYFLFGGFNLLTSEGEKGKVETARNQLTYAFFGLVVIFCSFMIMKFVGFIFGIDVLNLTLPSVSTLTAPAYQIFGPVKPFKFP